MKLSISRDNSNLTPEQPSIDENIEKANKELKEYVDKLDRDEIPMWLTNIIISIFQKGDERIMDKFVADGLKAIQKTELDDKVYVILADMMKEQIPGTDYEPIIGEAMVGIGEQLKKPVKK